MGTKLSEGWINHLRSASRQDKTSSVKCPQCDADVAPDINEFRAHVLSDASKHTDFENNDAIEDAFRNITLGKSSARAVNRTSDLEHIPPRSARKRPVSGGAGGVDEPDRQETASDAAAEATQRGSKKKLCSPPASDIHQKGSSPPTSTPTPSHRSRARPQDSSGEFDRGYATGTRPSRRLFNPSDPVEENARPKSAHPKNFQSRQANRGRPPPAVPTRPQVQDGVNTAIDPEHPNTSLAKEPETKPISQEQLVAEVKTIYAGLVMIEAKCIEVDNAQSSNTEHPLSSEQWQALIALHRTLLHEHHDFFLASQHPAANPALRRLASKYAMPARMWRHAIHSFLELLRHRLPASYEHMLTFIYLAYSMIALLYETVPAFEDTWIECLGDLGRYRMAIEDNDLKDRETWTSVARYWYGRASEKSSTTGRLYHHLAILARPNAIQQLYFYTKSLSVPIPFPSAKESIMTLFDPLFTSATTRLSPIDAAFVRAHGIMFSGKNCDELDGLMAEYLRLLDPHIARTTKRWLETGYYTGIPLCCSLLGYGAESHFLMKAISQHPETGIGTEGSVISEAAVDNTFNDTFAKALPFTMRTYEIAVRRWGDPNTLPFLHTILVFMHFMTRLPSAIVHLEKEFPWKLTAVMLNYLYFSCKFDLRIDTENFPGALKNDLPRPLPEDFALRGLVYTEDYFPLNWFKDSQVEDDEKQFELASMTDQRKERLLWLGRMIARSGQWLTWDDEARKFGVAEPYAAGTDDISLEALEALDQQGPASPYPDDEKTGAFKIPPDG